MSNCQEILVHTFLSNGLMSFGEVFIESFAKQHGMEIPILISSVGLSSAQIEQLEALHDNIEIRNKPLDMQAYAKRLKVDLPTLERWKQEIEEGVVTNENFHWKILMSVEERYRSLSAIALEARDKGFKKLFHSDIDMYFRKPLDGMWSLLSDHDIAILFRPEMPERAKVLGALIGFQLTDAAMEFLECWDGVIDEIPTHEKPIGYGQTSFYRAHLKQKDNARWCDLGTTSLAPKMSKTQESDAEIWVGNNHGGRITKKEAAENFKKDLKGAATNSEYESLKLIFPEYSNDQASASFRQSNAKLEKLYQSNGNYPIASVLPLLEEIKSLSSVYNCASLLDLGAFNNRIDAMNELSDSQGNSYKSIADFISVPEVSYSDYSSSSIKPADLCVVAGVLEHFSILDVTWMLDTAFSQAKKLVAIYVSCGHEVVREGEDAMVPQAWRGLVQATAARYPGLDYLLICKKTLPNGTSSYVKFSRPKADNKNNELKKAADKTIAPKTVLGGIPKV